MHPDPNDIALHGAATGPADPAEAAAPSQLQEPAELSDGGFDRAATAPSQVVRARQAAHDARREARKAAPTQWMDPPPPRDEDMLWRALTRDGEARLLVVRATEAASEATRRLECSPEVAKLVGELMVAALLVRSTINPEERLQLYLNHEGVIGQVAIDAWQEGGIRAYVARPQQESIATEILLGAGVLQVSRTLGTKSYGSSVALTGETAADFVMHYLMESEQILSLVHTDVQLDPEGQISMASGYLLQMMPEGTREDLRRIVLNIGMLPAVSAAMTAEDPDARKWAEQLLHGFAWDQCAREVVAYRCRCSRDRMMAMLTSLPVTDIAELAEGTEPLELVCDYCRRKYHVRPAELRELVAAPS